MNHIQKLQECLDMARTIYPGCAVSIVMSTSSRGAGTAYVILKVNDREMWAKAQGVDTTVLELHIYLSSVLARRVESLREYMDKHPDLFPKE